MTTIYSAEYKSSVQKELSRIQKLQEVLAKEAARLQSECNLFGGESKPSKKVSALKKVNKAAPKKLSKTSFSAQMREAIIGVLEGTSEALTTKQIYEAILKRNPKFKGDATSLSTVISANRGKLFDSPEPKKYQLAQ